MHLVEVAENLAGDVLPTSLLVVHNTRRRRQDHKAVRTCWKHGRDPPLNLVQRHRVARGDHTALVDAANQLDNDLASAVVIDDLKVTNVT